MSEVYYASGYLEPAGWRSPASVQHLLLDMWKSLVRNHLCGRTESWRFKCSRRSNRQIVMRAEAV